MTRTAYSMVVAIFHDVNQAQQAVNALLQAGFDRDQINFAGHGNPQGPFAGLKRLFSGEGSSARDAYNDLIDRGMPEQEARYYQQEYDNGRSIVAITGVDRLQEAATLLSSYGGYGTSRRSANDGGEATDAVRRSANYGENTDTVRRSANYRNTTDAIQQSELSDTQGEQRMRLHEEKLQIYKQPVQTGEARLRKEVVSEQQSIDVPITREEVVIERRPGSGQPSNRPIGEEETYKVPVREEQVKVNKQAVVREEVALGRRQVQDTRRVSDTVRREEARVEHDGDINIQGQDAALDREESRLGKHSRHISDRRDERDSNRNIPDQNSDLDRP